MARYVDKIRRNQERVRQTCPGVETLESRIVLSTLPVSGWNASNWISGASRPSVAQQEISHGRVTPTSNSLIKLGTVVGDRTIQGLSLDSGEEAWFRFRTLSPGHSTHWVGAAFATERGDLDLELYDSRDRMVSRASKGRNMEDATLRGLPAGTYTLRVFAPRGESQDSYNLVFRTPQKPVSGDQLDRAVRNATPARAFSLGIVMRTEQLNGLSKSNSDDWFRFRATGPGGSAQIDFASERGDLDLELYRLAAGAAGPGQLAVGRSAHLELVARSAGFGDLEKVALDPNSGGTYFVRVYGYEGSFNPLYRLTVAQGGVDTAPAAASLKAAVSAAVDWFSQNLVSALGPLVSQLMTSDGQLSRTDMLTIFDTVEQDGTVTAGEYQDLQTIVQNTSNIVMPAPVRNLTSKVVGTNLANALYQAQPLGNLAAGSSATQLQNLVNKWFLGLDHPSSVPGDGDNHTYPYGSAPAAGNLFGSTILYTDVNQGLAGDCYLLSSLANLALHSPELVQDLIVANGDGTYTVRFYYDQQGTAIADYVTVDGYFPVYEEEFVFADSDYDYTNPNNILWVPLVEKAYAQWSAEGHNGQIPKSAWTNSYFSISNSGGYADKTLGQLTGSFTYTALNPTASTLAQAIAAFNAGSYVVFGTNGSSGISDPKIVDGHDYAMVGYDATTQIVTLYNPWGLAGGYSGDTFYPGKLELTQAQILANFDDLYFDDLTS